MEIIPDERRLVGLVEQAHQGKLCLPNLQRDFVWTREQVADLLRSILRRYFLGSLPLLRCGLGDGPRTDLRRYYWCNVFLERYSSRVETKSRRDWQEMRARTGAGGPAPSVFVEAQARIGAEGYAVSDSASYASAVYSGIFCLLALCGARDWAAGEAIALQQLEDHHIFPRSYLTARGFDSRKDKARINTVLNRTLIANETNGRISNSAPAQYLADAAVFPQQPLALLRDHFVDDATLAAMQKATTDLDGNALARVYDEFCRARQAVIVAEIRRVCGVQAGKPAPAQAEGIDDE